MRLSLRSPPVFAQYYAARRACKLSRRPTPPTGLRNRAPSCPATLQPRATNAPGRRFSRGSCCAAFPPTASRTATAQNSWPCSTASCSAPHSPTTSPPWAWRARPVGRPPPRCACCSLRLRLHRTRSTPKLSGQTPDVRWLAGVNQAAGITFFNREQFDELLTWLQLPALIQIAHAESTQPKSAHSTGIAAIESLRRRRPQGRASRWLQPEEVAGRHRPQLAIQAINVSPTDNQQTSNPAFAPQPPNHARAPHPQRRRLRPYPRHQPRHRRAALSRGDCPPPR